MAAKVAAELGHGVMAFPANWKDHGRSAGPIRNQAMLATEPELVIAFWDGKSRGTKDMLARARKAGVECVVLEHPTFGCSA